MRFFPGLTPEKIAGLTYRQFVDYLAEADELGAEEVGAEPTITAEQIAEDLSRAEEAGKIRAPRKQRVQ